MDQEEIDEIDQVKTLDYILFPRKMRWLWDVPGYIKYHLFLREHGYKTRTQDQVDDNMMALCVLLPYNAILGYIKTSGYDLETAHQNRDLCQKIAEKWEAPIQCVPFRLACIARLYEHNKQKGENFVYGGESNVDKEMEALFEQAKQNTGYNEFSK